MLRLAMCVGLGLAAVQVSACGDDEGCKTNSDCAPGQICRIGLCALDPNQADGTVTSEAGPDITLECRAATPADLVLNEIMADPPSGADIDGDGTASTTNDEFVEIVNVGIEPVALTGVEIDVGGKRGAFDAVCLNPNQAQLMFGSGKLPGLTNSGGTVSLIVSGAIAQTHTYGSEAGNDESITLMPQLDKTTNAWVRSGATWGPKYTPGKCSDLSDFPNCGTSPVVEGDVETVDSETITPQCSDLPTAADLVINEIMADPGGIGGNDSNGDGVVSSDDDEFVEIVNVSQATLLLTGVKLKDASNADFTFPAGTCVAPNQAIVIFGKYTGTGDFAGVLAFDDLGFAVNNTSETLTLSAADGSTLSTVSTGSLGGNDQSIVRTTDLDATAAFVNHSTAPNAAGAKMSPGRCQSGADFPDCSAPPVEVVEGAELVDVVDDTSVPEVEVSEVSEEVTTEVVEEAEVGPACGPLATAADLAVNEVLLDPPAGYDANGDATADTTQDEFVEIISLAAAPVRLDGLQIWDSVALKYTIPAATCLGPNEALVVFGKGAKIFAATGVTTVDTTSHALDLNNSPGDTLSIRASVAEILLTHAFLVADDQSWTRSPDVTGAFVKHKTANAALPASPGQCLSGAALPTCLAPVP